MSWLTGVMAALLRCPAGLLPANRRVWADALLAEAGAVPAGRHRLAWLAGGVRLTVREAALARRLTYALASPPQPRARPGAHGPARPVTRPSCPTGSG